jgi:hypothetical protein
MSEQELTPDEEIVRTLREAQRRSKPGHPAGTMVCPITNKIVPIPGAASRYENGKPVIDVPLQARKPRWEKMTGVRIQDLVDVDGRIDEAKTDGPDA